MKNTSTDKIGGSGNNTSPKKIVVLGVGNELLSDEGVGVHIVKELQKMDIPQEIDVIEGGTNGFGLINIITETDRLIVIDSLKGGSKPGTIYKFNVKDAPNSPDIFKTSVHQISILEVINLSSLIGKTPETTVIGIEPRFISTGMELSPDVRAKIPRVIELVMEEINMYFESNA